MTERKRLLIFDKHAGGERGVDSLLDPERHDIAGTARDLTHAATLLLALKEGTITDVDAIIITGTLEGEDEYAKAPVSYPEVVTKKRLRGGEKTKVKNRVVELPHDDVNRANKSAEVTTRLINGLFDDESKPTVLAYSRGYREDKNMMLHKDTSVDSVLVDSPSEPAKISVSDWVDKFVK